MNDYTDEQIAEFEKLRVEIRKRFPLSTIDLIATEAGLLALIIDNEHPVLWSYEISEPVAAGFVDVYQLLFRLFVASYCSHKSVTKAYFNLIKAFYKFESSKKRKKVLLDVDPYDFTQELLRVKIMVPGNTTLH